MTDYAITVIDRQTEGSIGIQVKDKLSNFTCVFFSNYLPPDGSTASQNSIEFFGHLLAELYTLNDADIIVLCGDYNARIGKKMILLNALTMYLIE